MIDYREIGLNFKVPIYYCDEVWDGFNAENIDTFCRKFKQHDVSVVDLTSDAITSDEFANIKTLFQNHDLLTHAVFLLGDYLQKDDDRVIWFPFYFYNSSWWNCLGTLYPIGNRRYRLSCLNRTPRPQRLYTYYQLYRRGYLEESIVSHQCHMDPYTGEKINIDDLDFDIIPYNIQQEILALDLYRESIPGADWIQNGDHSVNNPAFRDCYLNVVTETSIGASLSFSEKICKPFISGQLFTVVGPQDCVRVLDAIGFNTFGAVLDQHNYCKQDNWISRVDKMFDLLDQIRPNIEDLYLQSKSALKHNQAWIQSEEFRSMLTKPLRDLDLIQ